MRKSLLASAVVAAMGTTGAAQATVIDMTRMDFYDGSQTYNTTKAANGSIDTVAATGTFTGTFFSSAWTSTVMRTFTTTGSHTWSDADDASAQGSYSYNFDVGAGQVGVGMFFDWSTSKEIPVIEVFDCTGGTADPQPDSSFGPAQCTAVDSDTDGAPGHQMQTDPFPGQTPAFYGNVVPVPAAVWLFGSGLIGLVGVARRRKAS